MARGVARALGFTYLSPVVGVYTLFGIALATAGPPMFWWLVFVGIVVARAVPDVVLAIIFVRIFGIGALTGAQEFDWQAGHGAHGERRAAAGVAVHLGHHQARDRDVVAEALRVLGADTDDFARTVRVVRLAVSGALLQVRRFERATPIP